MLLSSAPSSNCKYLQRLLLSVKALDEAVLVAGPTPAMGNEHLEPLPDAPPNLAGESEDHGSRYHITVSNASGYLCHIHMQVRDLLNA